MGMNDIYFLFSNHAAEQTEKLKVEEKFLRRRAHLGVAFWPKRSRPMYRGAANLDVLLSRRISDDMKRYVPSQ